MSDDQSPRQVDEAKEERCCHAPLFARINMIEKAKFHELGRDDCGMHHVVDVVGEVFIKDNRKDDLPVNDEKSPEDDSDKLADRKGQSGKQEVTYLLQFGCRFGIGSMAAHDTVEQTDAKVNELYPHVPKGQEFPLATKSSWCWEFQNVPIPINWKMHIIDFF